MAGIGGAAALVVLSALVRAPKDGERESREEVRKARAKERWTRKVF